MEPTEPDEGGNADLEYDLAHEAAGVEQAPAQDERADQVVTTTPEYDGDYSYDLAHDIPPAGQG